MAVSRWHRQAVALHKWPYPTSVADTVGIFWDRTKSVLARFVVRVVASLQGRSEIRAKSSISHGISELHIDAISHKPEDMKQDALSSYQNSTNCFGDEEERKKQPWSGPVPWIYLSKDLQLIRTYFVDSKVWHCFLLKSVRCGGTHLHMNPHQNIAQQHNFWNCATQVQCAQKLQTWRSACETTPCGNMQRPWF